jgi:hypothetical protein
MKACRWTILGVLMLLLMGHSPSALARQNTEDDLQQWTVVTFKADLPHKLRLYAEVQPRLGHNIQGVDRLLLRPAIGYQLTPAISLWQGYAWTPTFLDGNGNAHFNDEHRIFQQVLIENKWDRLKLTNRTRLEERFIEGARDTAVRARHMTRLAYAFDHDKKWSLVGYDELFWNLNDTQKGPQSGFDQNRSFLGVNRKLTPNLDVEAGYLLDFVNRAIPKPDKANHALLIGVNYHL